MNLKQNLHLYQMYLKHAKGAVSAFILLLFMTLVSCSDQDLTVTDGEEITTSVSVRIPEIFNSRSFAASYPADAVNYIGESGYPSIGNVDLNEHPLSFTVGVYVEKTVNGNQVYTLVEKQSRTGVTDDKADFNFRLMKGQSYRIVAYADFSGTEKENLEDISFTPELNNELSDAFYVSQTFNASETMTVVLKRPFGKIRLIAHDFSTLAKGDMFKIEKIKVTYAESAENLAEKRFNAIEGEFKDADENTVNRTFTADPVIYHKEYVDEDGNEVADANYAAVFTMYLPVNFGIEDTSNKYTPEDPEHTTKIPQSWMFPFNIEVSYRNADNKLVTIERSFDIEIPVKRNWLTTIDAADFWTDNSTVTVSIDHRFDGFIDNPPDPVTVKTANELQDAIDLICREANPNAWNTGKIILGADIDADQNERIATPGGFVFDSNKAIHIYLDLNGKKITTKGVNVPTYNSSYNSNTGLNVGGVIGVLNWNNILHIEDNSSNKGVSGGITHEGNAGANFYPLIRCMAGGQVVINDGTYISNSDGPVVWVYEQEIHHYYVLRQAYSEAYKGEPKLESGGYNPPECNATSIYR